MLLLEGKWGGILTAHVDNCAGIFFTNKEIRKGLEENQ
jgi:hypothetical protein